MIGNEVKKGNGFRDLNTYAQGCNGYLSAENRIKYLEMHRTQLGVSVGPGRGSAAGSAVAYCLGITKIDPQVQYRFLQNIGRGL